MRLALPREAGNLAAPMQRLVALIGARLERSLVDVTLPRFRIELTHDLVPVLTGMGMPLAFDEDEADLSGIDGKRELFVELLRQKTFVDVDEEGTEAAAVTVLSAPPGAGMAPGTPPKPIVFRADRPFLFWILESATGTLLFMGKLSRPPLHAV
jgi:serpin B